VGSSFSPRRDQAALVLVGGALCLAALLATHREVRPEWAAEQAKVRAIVEERLGPDAAARVPRGLRQVWIEELDRVDRCTACHVTIDWGEALADAPHPARSHPPGYLERHPVERFGCTLCHGGQGWATTLAAAHGQVAHWDDPLLDGATAAVYGLTARDLMESKCNTCHRHDHETSGLPLVNAARQAIRERRCDRCHRIDGVGGNRGPDLTDEGDKAPEHYAFPEAWTRRSVLRWHLEHLREPSAVVPGSQMPVIRLTDEQRAGIALMLMSWRRLNLPPEWLPRPRRSD
jgi:hypothetical protein